MSTNEIPDVIAIGDVECPCGEFVFPCVLVDEIGSNQIHCPFCNRLLETMETE